jgi:hypothetical protein
MSATEILQKGVGTYNKDNRDNKENKNNYCERDNKFSPISLGLASEEALETEIIDQGSLTSGQERGALPYLCQAGAPTPELDSDQIKSCILQLFDNGEAAKQRYKFKIRLNLIDGSNPEFIASLTKDMRNFRKYIPEPYKEDIIKFAKHIRAQVKQQHDTIAYLGKLHMNNSDNPRATKQIEPNTFVGVWWDPVERGWSGTILFQNWHHNFDLFTDYLTAKQKSMGVKCQDNWQNPKYDKRVRPLTWAEQRAQQ